MKASVQEELDRLLKRRPEIEPCRQSIVESFELMRTSLAQGGKILSCGNGGSAADSLHFVGELVKGFMDARPLTEEWKTKLTSVHPEHGRELSARLQMPLRALSLNASPSLSSAIVNDNGADMEFAQQVFGYGDSRDVLLAISTSGNSRNVVMATLTASAMGMKTVALVGRDGGELSRMSDVSIVAPGANTPEIQEAHLPIYHSLCIMLESEFYQ